jgi:uncharacterized protein (TIRG00374 family)
LLSFWREAHAVRAKQIIFTIARFIIGGALLVLLLWKAGTGDTLTNLQHLKPSYIVCAAGLFLCAVVTIAFRWKLLLAAHDIRIPFHKSIAYYLVGFFFNNFLPTVIGLDIIRAVYVSHAYGRKAECFASVISEKAIGLLAILLLGVLFLPLFIARDRFIIYIFGGLLGLTVLFIAGIFFFPHRGRITWLGRIFSFRLLSGLKERAKRLYDALYYYRNKKWVVIETLLISFVYQIILITIFYLIGRALGVSIPFYYFLAFVPVINIGSMIPITPNGIGIRESLCIYLFGLAHVESSLSILISMVYFGIALLVSVAGGVLFMIGFKRPPKGSMQLSS